MKLVTGFTRLFSRMLGGKHAPLDRSKLVGMYLSNTNDREGYLPKENRTRRNGKYSHHRERA